MMVKLLFGRIFYPNAEKLLEKGKRPVYDLRSYISLATSHVHINLNWCEMPFNVKWFKGMFIPMYGI